jgi:Protein of unknown function (DUF2846)
LRVWLCRNWRDAQRLQPLESQLKQRDARSARLYFLREKGIIGALGGTAATTDIKIDGKSVGALRNGFQLFVDRPAGLHTLAADNGVSMTFETEIQVEAGQTYYFNIGAAAGGPPGQVLLNQAYAGGSGEPMQAKSMFAGAMSGVAIYRMDAAAGAALAAQLQVP